MLRKPCRLQTDGRTDKVNPECPPPTSLGGGITNIDIINIINGKSVLMEENKSFVSPCYFHGHKWWPGDIQGQGINIHSLSLVFR